MSRKPAHREKKDNYFQAPRPRYRRSPLASRSGGAGTRGSLYPHRPCAGFRPPAHQPIQRVGLLLLIKTFQPLGYFVSPADIPAPVGRPVAGCAGYPRDSLSLWESRGRNGSAIYERGGDIGLRESASFP